MMAYLILGGVAVVLVSGAIACYKIRKSRQEINRLV